MELIHRPSGDPARSERLGSVSDRVALGRNRKGSRHGLSRADRSAPADHIGYHLLAEEFYFVLSGSGTAILQGREQNLRAGDFYVYLPERRMGS